MASPEILPALILQALGGPRQIRVEALVVGVLLHPLDRAEQLVPQRAEELQVAGVREIGRGAEQEQARRRIIAVVVKERRLAELGERPPLALVQHLPRLRVVAVVGLLRIPAADHLQRAAQRCWVERGGLQGGDIGIAPEQPRIIRHARHDHEPLGTWSIEDLQRGKVGDGLLPRCLHREARGRQTRAALGPVAARLGRGGVGRKRPVLAIERLDRLALEDGNHLHQYPARVVRAKAEPTRDGFAQIGQLVAAGDADAGRELKIGMLVAKLHRPFALAGPPLLPRGPAPLDERLLLALAGLGLAEIGEVGREVEREGDRRLDHRVVGHVDVEAQAAAGEGVDLHLDAFLDDLPAAAAAAVVLGRCTGRAPGRRRREVVRSDEMMVHGVCRDERHIGPVNLDPQAREKPGPVKVEPLHPIPDTTARVGHQHRVSPMRDQVGRPHRAPVHVPKPRRGQFPLAKRAGDIRSRPAALARSSLAYARIGVFRRGSHVCAPFARAICTGTKRVRRGERSAASAVAAR